MKKFKWILLIAVVGIGIAGFFVYKEVTKPKNIFEEMSKVEERDSRLDTKSGLTKIGYRRAATIGHIDEKGTVGLEKKFDKTHKIDFIFVTLPGSSILDDPSVAILYKTKLSDKENIVYDYLYDLKDKSFFKRIDYNMNKKNLSKYGLTEKEVEKDYKKVFKEKIVKVWINTYKGTRFTENNIGNVNFDKGKIY